MKNISDWKKSENNGFLKFNCKMNIQYRLMIPLDCIQGTDNFFFTNSNYQLIKVQK